MRNSIASWRSPSWEKLLLYEPIRTLKSRDDIAPDVHNVGNISGNLHERARRSKCARDMFRGYYFAVGQRPATQVLIQLWLDERHRNSFEVHRGSCTEVASDVEGPSSILDAASLTTNCARFDRRTWQNVVHRAQLRSIIPAWVMRPVSTHGEQSMPKPTTP